MEEIGTESGITEAISVRARSQLGGGDPLVSVFVWTYNDQPYLAECLESILSQETVFDIEIIIHDDASTDGTSEIARAYAARYPGVVRSVIQPENKWSKGGDVMEDLPKLPRGEFVALMHGDDFWTSSHKLEHQVAHLRGHPEAAGCFTDWSVIDSLGKVVEPRPIGPDRYEDRYDQWGCLFILKSYYATSSLLFRSSVFDQGIPDWFQGKGCDYFLDALVTREGGLDFLSESTTAYRIHGGGVWSSVDPSEHVRQFIKRIRILKASPEMVEGYEEDLSRLEDRQLGILLGNLVKRASESKPPGLEKGVEIPVPWFEDSRERWDLVAGRIAMSLRKAQVPHRLVIVNKKGGGMVSSAENGGESHGGGTKTSQAETEDALARAMLGLCSVVDRLSGVSRRRQAELKAKEAKLEAMQASWSWRLTAPLRTFASVIRRLRRRRLPRV